MACCGQSGCACIVQPGSGIAVTGTGTTTDPYIIASTFNDLGQFLRVIDTTSVNLTLTGTGTVDDPLTLRATSTLALTELSDVNDPSGGPAVGESPVWVGSGSDGHWEFQIPPPSPEGAVNVSTGLDGIGSVGDPILVKVSGEWGVAPLDTYGPDSTVGLPIYEDSNGELRAQPASSVSWAAITGKPASFTPSPHTHPVSDLTDLSTNGNAARVNGIKISSTPNSVTPPGSPSTGDLWFFPEGT